MNYLQELTASDEIFFRYMKEKYRLFYNSNIFLRDIQYAIKSFFQRKNMKLKYLEAEKLAFDFTELMENKEKLKKVGNNAWKVNFLLQ